MLCSTVQLTLRNRKTPDNRMKLYKLMLLLVLMVASETWTMIRKETQHIQTSEIKILGRTIGYRLEHQRIMKILTWSKLDIFTISDNIGR